MNLYVAITALALYGDLLKRVVGATGAILTTYALFGLIIVTCFTKRRAPEAQFVRIGGNGFSTICLVLIGVYLIQLLTHIDAPLDEAISSAFYIILPLTYLVTIAQRFPQFNLYKLGQSFLVLMPPILVVGLIQYIVNDSFLIDTTYSEAGGVIERNFLDNDISNGEKNYKRLPSLLASADRLSAVGMMQMYFCALVLRGYRKMTLRHVLWLLFSLMSAIAVLTIAGARSRILIIGVAVALSALPMLKNKVAPARQRRCSAGVSPVIVILIFAAIGGGVLSTGIMGTLDSVPIIRQLNATAETGEVWVRIMEFFTESSIPDDVTIFGRGLGVAGVGGRPGEFALRAMWIESGVFWTALMLPMYVALVLRLAQYLAGAIRRQEPIDIFLCAIPLLTWISGLMAGLSATFELSTALTLFPAIAVMTRDIAVSPVGRSVHNLWSNPLIAARKRNSRLGKMRKV